MWQRAKHQRRSFFRENETFPGECIDFGMNEAEHDCPTGLTTTQTGAG